MSYLWCLNILYVWVESFNGILVLWECGTHAYTQSELVIRGKMMFSCHVHCSPFYLFSAFDQRTRMHSILVLMRMQATHIFFPHYYYLPHISREKLRFQSVSHCPTNYGIGDWWWRWKPKKSVFIFHKTVQYTIRIKKRFWSNWKLLNTYSIEL